MDADQNGDAGGNAAQMQSNLPTTAAAQSAGDQVTASPAPDDAAAFDCRRLMEFYAQLHDCTDPRYQQPVIFII